MCGILGLVGEHAGFTPELFISALNLMTHRGPDDWGVEQLVCPSGQVVALGHRRLSILDLSAMGHQPMKSDRTGSWIVFNGEVYNFLEIREELIGKGYKFRSQCDTEVILAAYGEWGSSCLARFNGMFAIGIYDPRTRTVLLARDRVGIKPLYYCQNGKCLAFSSELSSLRELRLVQAEIAAEYAADYFAYGYFPGESTALKGHFKLRPGHLLEYRLDDRKLTIRPYWNAVDVFNAEPIQASEEELTDHLEGLLLSSVKHQMISDVPIGVFLSGGIDSATVTALMAKLCPGNTKTFTIGFTVPQWDEAPFAKKVADHLGTDHHEMYVSPDGLEKAAVWAASVYDEPFADTSCIPTLLLSQLTRKHVTVALSGDGGDELFYGYPRYRRAAQFLMFKQLPGWIRGIGRAMLAVCPSPRVRGWAYAFQEDNVGDFYAKQTNWRWPRLIQHDSAILGERMIQAAYACLPRRDWRKLPSLADFGMYLPDDILTKVDRASMAVSLETRVPILDHRIVEFAFRLPISLQCRGGVGKYLLKKVLARHIPPELWDRPKSGFAIPLCKWFREDLRSWVADELLGKPDWMLGIILPEVATKMINDHLAGTSDYSPAIWAFISWKKWCQKMGLTA